MINLQTDLECLKQAYQDAKDAYEVQLLLHTADVAKGGRGSRSTVTRKESAYNAAARKLADAVCGRGS